MEWWSKGIMQTRLFPSGLGPTFSFLSCFVNLIFPINHSVNSPKPLFLSLETTSFFTGASVPSFQHPNWGEKPLVDAVMPKGVAESPEFVYYVGHKEPFFDRINPAIRGAGRDFHDGTSFPSTI